MNTNIALRLAALVGLGTAGYHAFDGDRIIKDLPLTGDDMDFVSGTFQLGTMGWVAGAALLFGASKLGDQQARNWIVGVVAALYGIPAVGTLTLTGGEISLGGVLLATATALALVGRKLPAAGVAKAARALVAA